MDCYPISNIENLFAKLAGGTFFSKLDISQAYQQIQMEEESRKLVVINMLHGIFQYRRLPFGEGVHSRDFPDSDENRPQQNPQCIFLSGWHPGDKRDRRRLLNNAQKKSFRD